MVNKNNYCVQWTGQYYVAYELSKRGYAVSFTIGNSPEKDMMFTTPNGVEVGAEIKTHSGINSWLFKRPINPNTFWFFVVINPSIEKPRITIMTGKEVQQEWDDHLSKCPNDNKNPGIYDTVVRKYQHKCWDKLPK